MFFLYVVVVVVDDDYVVFITEVFLFQFRTDLSDWSEEEAETEASGDHEARNGLKSSKADRLVESKIVFQTGQNGFICKGRRTAFVLL
jgi:hypothetical protein